MGSGPSFYLFLCLFPPWLRSVPSTPALPANNCGLFSKLVLCLSLPNPHCDLAESLLNYLYFYHTAVGKLESLTLLLGLREEGGAGAVTPIPGYVVSLNQP